MPTVVRSGPRWPPDLPGHGSSGSSCSGTRRRPGAAAASRRVPCSRGPDRRSRRSMIGDQGAVTALVGQRAQGGVDHDHDEHGHRPATGGPFAAVGHERHEEQDPDQHDREDEDDERLEPAGAQRQQAEQPEERPLGPRIGAAQRRVGRTGRPLGTEDRRQESPRRSRPAEKKTSLSIASPRNGDPSCSSFSYSSSYVFGIDRLAGDGQAH